MSIKKLFGFLARSSAKFSKRKGKILSVFTKTKEELLKVIKEEQNYINELKKQRDNITTEIENSATSLEESRNVVERIDNFLK